MRAQSLVALLLLIGVAAEATDLELRLEATGEYDSNVFATDEDELDDLSLRLSPRLRALDETGDLQWELRYAPRYRKFGDLGELDGWDQDAKGRVFWRPTRRTNLRLSALYVEYAGFDRLLTEEVIDDGSIETGIELGRQQIRQTVIDAGLSHQLAQRHLLDFSASWHDTRYEDFNRSDTEVATGGLSYLYDLDPTDRLGLLLRVTRQTVVGIADTESLDTNYYNVSAQWIHVFDPTLSLQASVGPTWVESELAPVPEVLPFRSRFPTLPREEGGFGPVRASTCPQLSGQPTLGEGCQPFGADVQFGNATFLFETVDLPLLEDQGSTSESLTYFASVALTKQWERYVLSLRYVRDASTTTQVAGVVRDSFSAVLTWKPRESWSVSMNALYETREQTFNGRNVVTVLRGTTVGGISDVGEAIGFKLDETDETQEAVRYFAGVYVQYYATRRTTLFSNIFWTRSEFESDGFDKRVTDRFGIWLGVRYTFERFQLPI